MYKGLDLSVLDGRYDPGSGGLTLPCVPASLRRIICVV